LEILFALLILLLLLLVGLVLLTVVGHLFWLLSAWFISQLRDDRSDYYRVNTERVCHECGARLTTGVSVCLRCSLRQPSDAVSELLKDIAATERQLERFHDSGHIEHSTYDHLRTQLTAERERLTGKPDGQEAEPVASPPPSVTEPQDKTVVGPSKQTVVAGSFIATEDEIVIEPAPVPTFINPDPLPGNEETQEFPPFDRTPPEPRRSFAEVLNSFMEESNIRWGEIVGGLLIIGCSTALVVSLWSEISQIPVVKFLIFTTVTAALFGVGLYTEHRWKLPTTSRGILTIATLLVPLNFLAIAAVSGGMETGGAAIIASELIAPAVFLCLVYFAGKVLTPSWPHLLAAGVLGSSVGQLLIRHFASPDLSPTLLVALGAIPLAFYVATTVWMLKSSLFASEDIDSTPTFITLGALTFAAVLPFSLLLYKTGPVAMTMMYLAPLVSFAGFPSLATGLLLWKRFAAKEAVITRTVGTTLAIIGTLVVVAGVILAWPNPASIVPAAIFNFAVFTALAIVLEIPLAHVLAGLCLALAYLVLFHVLAGRVAWLNLRETSLLSASLSVHSGLALAPFFIAFVAVAEWLHTKQREAGSQAHIIVASLVATVSLLLTTGYGVSSWRGPLPLWFAYGTCSLGTFWIGWRRVMPHFTWAGSILLLVALGQAFALLEYQFPWQTAVFVHATICGVALLFLQKRTDVAAFFQPLRDSAFITSAFAVITLVQSADWETTSLQAQRVFWLAGIWLVLVWVTRKSQLFVLFQAALTLAVVLSIKATLQQFAWYAYLPHAFLHPWGLQIQGTALVLLSLLWIAVRQSAVSPGFATRFSEDAHRLLNLRWATDRIVLWSVLAAFVALSVYGALPGITRELTAMAQSNPSWDIAGFPHEKALEIGSWILLALLMIAFLGTVWQRRRSIYLDGTLIALACLCPLLAGVFEETTATASAWRWAAAFFLAFASLALWFRKQLAVLLQTLGWPGLEIDGARLARRERELLIALSLIPLLLLTIYPAVRAVYYMPIHGPAAGLFAQLDPRLSYTFPLVVVSLVLIGHGLRERLPEYVFASGLLFNASVTIAYLLSVVSVGGSMNRVVVVQLLQLNAIVFAMYALVWLAASRYWPDDLSGEKRQLVKRLLAAELLLAALANGLLIAPTFLSLSMGAELLSIGGMAVGAATGWVAFLLTIAAAIAFVRVYDIEIRAISIFLILIAAPCLLACGFLPDNGPNSAAFHVFLISITTSAWLLLLARRLPRQLSATPFAWMRFEANWEQQSPRIAAVTGVLAGFLSLRLWGEGSSSDWWSIGPQLCLAILFGVINWFTLQRRFIYLGGVAFTTAVFVWASSYYSYPEELFISIHVIALSLSSIVWLWLELRARRLQERERRFWTSFHNVATAWLLALMSIVVVLRLLVRTSAEQFHAPGLIDWLALVSLVAVLFACLWDKYAKLAVAAIYITGLLAIAQFLDQLSLSWPTLVWTGTLAIALYTIFTTLIWRRRALVLNYASSLGIPSRIDEDTKQLQWLVAFNLLLIVGVLLVGYNVILTYSEFPRRITIALAVGLQCLTFALFAEGKTRRNWQRAAVVMLIIGLVFCGWSVLSPSETGTWFNRAVITMVELFAVVGLYGSLFVRTSEGESDWRMAVQDTVPWIAGAGVLGLLLSLITEVFYQIEFGAVVIAPLALFAIGATLVAGICISLLFALSSEHDPLQLSERGRMGYVYAAEAMLALLFMHVRLTMPWLFSGFFERYWPLVVMAIAYAGVATGESLRRRRLLVLAQPLERTGVFLPLLPVLGFWLAQSEVDYSALLFIVGGLYGLLSLLRRSFVFGLLAAIAGNGGLWYLWHRSADFQFLQHPQLWLIPVAVSALIAVYLNEEDFTEQQMASIRYLCLVTIYASSTADIFINGVAESPWLPLVLAALSLAGVFGGIVFRIRGFLLLGSVFLLLSILTMIWYASANLGWTWLWYVAGIVTGATIIFMFAVFEKKRSEVLRVVEGLKEWER
jgi:hypothetical protein